MAMWDRWKEVDQIFDAALDVPAGERDEFVARACAGDAELSRMVRELLELTGKPADHLSAPGAALVRAAWQSSGVPDELAEPLTPGARVGSYRIVAELGRGGMATVYDAERADGAFQQRVAVKVLRRGVDTDDVVRRFIAERQILSTLTHPNIARLLDGGATEDGRPFFVMDRVVGEPIAAFVTKHGLAKRGRLQLLLQVVDAVQYAHRHLIVHRDLKPSNILVTADGQAKLLDFGIAKLLGPETEDATRTRAGLRLLTPEYASPEQLRGGTVTTASDVYQLGVLLHILLTGERPVERGEPRTRRVHDRDLGVIVAKALRPEPEQRYESAQSMGDDLRRYLAGLPIAARPPSVRYRFEKFASRNRWFVPSAVVLLLAVSGFGVTRVRHTRQLERERNEARAQAARAEQLRTFLVDLFGSADPWAPADPQRGRHITVVEALALGAERARSELADRPLLQADLLSSIARVYEGLDQRELARSLLDEVLDLRRTRQAERTPDYADELGRHARLLDAQWDSARAQFQAQIELERELHGSAHPRVANARISYSNLLSVLGEYEGTLEQRQRAIEILRAGGADQRSRLADALGLISDTYRELQRPQEAEDAARESFDIQRELHGDEHPSTATARIHLAQVADARGRTGESIRLYREALPVLERTLGEDHFITVASWNNLGIVLMAAQDYSGAEAVHRRMLDARRRLSGGEPTLDLAGSLQNLSAAVIRQERFAEAESLSLDAFRMYSALLPETHHLRAFPLLTIAEAQLLSGDGARSERTLRTALDVLRAALPANHFAVAAAECRLGAAIAEQGQHREAETIMRGALATLESNEQVPVRFVRECTDALDAVQAER